MRISTLPSVQRQNQRSEITSKTFQTFHYDDKTDWKETGAIILVLYDCRLYSFLFLFVPLACENQLSNQECEVYEGWGLCTSDYLIKGYMFKYCDLTCNSKFVVWKPSASYSSLRFTSRRSSLKNRSAMRAIRALCKNCTELLLSRHSNHLAILPPINAWIKQATNKRATSTKSPCHSW